MSRTRRLAASRTARATRDSGPLPAPQAPEAGTQLVERARAHRLVFSARHREPHRTIKWRQIAWLQPARLPLFQPQPHHTPDAWLDIEIGRASCRERVKITAGDDA